MSKLKYCLVNGNDVLGYLWETEKLGNVLIMNKSVDFNTPLEIYIKTETRGFEKVSEIDMVTDFMEILQYNLKKEGLE